jgi:hypothetical protein
VWFLDATHRLDVVDIYAKLFKNPTMHDKLAVRTRMYVPINSNCDNVKLQTVSVILTFEVGTWSFDATNHLDLVDICAKLFQNLSMYDKFTVGHA